ncbi:unnamed protein product [Adineta steineri]|uniref:Uncharacterized protein n=1 Tax=Adineta steineri TaxID=433720 RepID=A0A815ECP3_9BILA|nr:unnamed protein product [Adineta steineri]CAF1313181.1 unnamed protein product [Adineta steineri]CAF1382677.1 unnamed protein product [Adineta steineri]CAF1401496.1 unnamed protein product [Adineta steineri]
MFGIQTLACLHDIPVVRSSTNKLQDVYVQAKKKSALIRLPCMLAETVADKSLKIAVSVTNPIMKPLRGPVRVIDDFTVEKIRQIEAKYPVINTSTKDVMNTLNEKTEPVRNVMNTVKDTTTSTIQHGKETVSNVKNATVNKATNVADSVYTFCETHVPGKTVPVHRRDFGQRTTLLWERIKSIISYQADYMYQSIEFLVTWYRMLIVSFLLKIKQTNDTILNKLNHRSLFFVLPHRLLIITGMLLEYMMTRFRPENRTETKPQSRSVQQKQFVSRQTLKPGALVTTRQSVVVTKQETSVTCNGVTKSDFNKEELYPRLPVNHIEPVLGNDIDKLHNKLHPTDTELLYSRLPADVISMTNNFEPLTEDQRMLHAQIIAADLEKEVYAQEEDEDYYVQ